LSHDHIVQPPPLYRLENVYKSYGDKTILNGLHFDLPAGCNLVVMGRSGTGKSVLLRLLDGWASRLARIWPGLFAYQFVVEATRLDDADDILDSTIASTPVSEAP
jgi:ATPase subunit of ABC transporter with duplicated ATPase domains